jgi:hypothetical protein
MRNPESYRKQLGSSFVKRLVGETIITIGNQSWSRDRLVRYAKCGNFAAAKRLQHALEAAKVETTKELQTLDPLVLAQQKGVGETTIYVLLCVQAELHQQQLSWGNVTWRTWRDHVEAEADAKRRSARVTKKGNGAA